jgi:hypothetical protein
VLRELRVNDGICGAVIRKRRPPTGWSVAVAAERAVGTQRARPPEHVASSWRSSNSTPEPQTDHLAKHSTAEPFHSFTGTSYTYTRSIMPPKQRAPASTGPQVPTTSTPARSSKSAGGADAQDILQGIYNKYVSKTPQRVKLLDTFMAFLVVVGALQFFYVVLVGNFVRLHPFAALESCPGTHQRIYD